MRGCAFLMEAFLMSAVQLTSFGTALWNAGTWLLSQ